jgi:hypothetical protein
MTNSHDYLAVILIGGGSSWGRSPDKEEAIRRAIANYRDWDVYYKVANTEVIINVTDVQGYSTVAWNDRGMHGKNEATGKDETIDRPIERVTRTTPKWQRRKTRV